MKQYEPCCGLPLWQLSPAVGFFIGVVMDYNKYCTKCQVEFPATLEFFHKHKRGKDGLLTRCKTCANKEQNDRLKERNKNNPPHRRHYSKHEIEFIKSNYGKIPTVKIAQTLNRKSSAIQQFARNQLGLNGVRDFNRKGTDHISLTYFNKLVIGAKSRNIEFDITIEELDELLVKQDFKCSLSGIEIYAGYRSSKTQTASLDRIDSSKGYILNNVQWVHKNINFAKGSLSQEDFIQMCIAVSSVFQSTS